MMRWLRLISVMALAAGSFSGCIFVSDDDDDDLVVFDPFGDDFGVEGEWSIDGEIPSAANCDAAGIDRVRIVFFDRGSRFEYDRLTFPCSAQGFETDRIFEYGDYTTEWQAILDDGTIVRGPMLPLSVDPPVTLVTLAPADFVVDDTFDPRGDDVSLSADWTINGDSATAALCDAAGIETMSIVLYDEDDTGRTKGVVVAAAPCGNGKFDSRPMDIIETGRYLTSIEALDADGEVLATYDSPNVLDTSLVDHAMLMTAPFEADLTTSLTVNLSWDTDLSDVMADGDCAEAGVSTFSYTLTDTADDSTYDMMTDITCGTEIFWDEIPPGTYELFIEAKGGGKGWQTTCTDLLVEENNAEVYNCPVDRTM